MAERVKGTISGEMSPWVDKPPQKKSKPDVQKPEMIKCEHCSQTKPAEMFYRNSPANGGGYCAKCCKECADEMSVNEDGIFTAENLYEVCRKLDRPFYADDFSAIKDAEVPDLKKADLYFEKSEKRRKNKYGFDRGDDLSVLEAKSKSDSEPLKTPKPKQKPKPQIRQNPDQKSVMASIPKKKAKDEMTEEELNECRELFGYGLSSAQYKRAKYLFDDMNNNYPLKTSMHKQKLAEWAVYKTMVEVAIANGDAGEAAKWGKLAKDTATDAKINPSQLSAADLSEGMTCFSQLSAAVEKAVDVIKLFPEFKEQPKDRVDYTLWEYVNCSRHMMGKPLIEYKELYSFLDKRAEELKGRYSFIKKEEDGHFDENDIGG